MITVEGKDGICTTMPANAIKHLGLFQFESEMCAGTENEDLEKRIKLEIEGQTELEFVADCLQNVPDIDKKVEDYALKGITCLMALKKVSSYLQFEELSCAIKNFIFTTVNRIATEGAPLADYFKIEQRTLKLREFMGVGEAPVDLGVKKALVTEARYLNGQFFPDILKFEDFYCKEKVEPKEIYTCDKRKEIQFEFELNIN